MNNKNIPILPLTEPADYLEALDLLAELGGSPRTIPEETIRTNFALCRQQGHAFFQARDGRKLVGIINIFPMINALSLTTWRINGLVVDKAYRKAGIGRHLMQACENHARAQGGKTMLLGVLTDNEQANTFYETIGYKVSARQFSKSLA